MLRAFTALRPLLLSLALLTGGGMIAASVAQPAFAQRAWRTHKDTKYGYRVEFPGVPSVSQETSPQGAVIDVAALEAGTTGKFMVVSTSGVEGDARQAIENGSAAILESSKGEVVERADLTIDGAPARDLTLHLKDKGIAMRIRLVVQGDKFFQVMAVGFIDTPLEGTDRFIDSFRLLPVAAPTAPGTMAPVADN
ncbi:hypothetical protein [Caulobacter sp. NIBR1757]|uniref:hypothetical protein n=1 Tax=Caulobacter sp. NIBR1757 TaxID=3016000 RepID=UPI0022F0D000|nr:hypothetical protein [Caulobacter sp. NIBR1757]WGM37112.1 hypothetical protein AMEJIAPC_00006 [Caulobacter sp. NIBR1757]